MYPVPMKRARKDDSNYTTLITQIYPKINLQGFRNKVTTCKV